MQYQAGYVLEAVRDQLNLFAHLHKKEAELQGLLRSLSTFDVHTQVKLQLPAVPPSILAVAVNMLTRGLPTYAGIAIEQHFANALACTQRKEDIGRGSIAFPLQNAGHAPENTSEEQARQRFYNALHVIDPRARSRSLYLQVSDVDSTFERDFLLRLIPEKHSYWAQLIQKQRSRGDIAGDNNHGRVDFSCEIPYEPFRTLTNTLRREVPVKYRKRYVVETDGAAYHTAFVDDLKDLHIGQVNNYIHHIPQQNQQLALDAFIKQFSEEAYIQQIERNYHNPHFLADPYTMMTLAPLAIARLQRVMWQYLMAHHQKWSQQPLLKVAVMERDFPCAHAAFNDLHRICQTLNELSQTQITLPQINLTVFGTHEFMRHPLQGGQPVQDLNTCQPTNFDLVLDIAMLRRPGIFKEDGSLVNNTILIRSVHFVHHKTTNTVVSGPPVKYRPLVNALPNEVYEPREEVTNLLKQLLRDIFRKLDFREGQLPILNRAMLYKSVIGLLPTGGGKSLTYQLAALLQPGTTIVVDPIRSLMVDQYNGLVTAGIDKCAFINSTLSAREREYNQSQLLEQGRLQFLFVSPERFVIDEFRMVLEKAQQQGHSFAYVVIDEVHCVSEWGHDFRTPYLNLGENAQRLCRPFNGYTQAIPLVGLTATASFDVLADIERELQIEKDDGHAVVRFENSIRDEINYQIKDVRCAFNEPGPLTQWQLRQKIGKDKQQLIFEAISNKADYLAIFNNEKTIENILAHSFNNYLSEAVRQKWTTVEGYKVGKLSRLHMPETPFKTSNMPGKSGYQYGIIVFMPHRKGWLGIKNSSNAYGVFENPDYVSRQERNNQWEHGYGVETLGYFMGSSDDDNAEIVDRESFEYLQKFKDNKASVMVATKAFGMGIDKPDVRMTIHINIPSSIESFVQEAGRAGRDGRMSTSIILYNNQLQFLKESPKEAFHLDKDVLMYFHRNSFKGQMKERTIIFELRNRIAFPKITNLKLLNEQINVVAGEGKGPFDIKLGGANHENRIFINTLTGTSVGYVYLDTQDTGIYRSLGNDRLCYGLVTWLKDQLPFSQYQDVPSIRNWLNTWNAQSIQDDGLEKRMKDMTYGQTGELRIPFINRYYSQHSPVRREFLLNAEHWDTVANTEAVRQLVQNGRLALSTVRALLEDAVYNGLDYPTYIESLKIEDPVLLKALLSESDSRSLAFQKAFYLPRSQQDTAKAIYRLVSIGVIDAYTIDYQYNFYTVSFTKKTNEQYFQGLQVLMARYTSTNAAEVAMKVFKAEAIAEIEAGKATILSKCLEYLTDFIYDKIKKKRLLAIEDMVNLCRVALTKADPLEQSQYIKDDIYYYFNAKYSRNGFVETSGQKASLLNDLQERIPIAQTIVKYLDLVEDANTGEFMTNVKHLRGSCMRLLRSDPDAPQCLVLKSFALFNLSVSAPELIREAIDELVRGLLQWKLKEDPSFSVTQFMETFITRVKAHISTIAIEKAFEEVDDLYQLKYYQQWMRTFTNQFLATQS